jgi:WS/DGAT/MGAT family acyltransferase
VFDTRRFALADFRQISGLCRGATVNDVVLAVCAGGLRRYLALQGELPERSLVAAAPISVKEGASGAEKDGFAWARIDLFTQLAEPLERLRGIAKMTSSSEVMARALGARELTDLSRHAPSAAISLSSKMLRAASARLGDWTPLANCTITNVPGPQQPLYLLGARLTYMSAIMPIADGMGLVFSVTSYNNMLVISFTGCYEQLPDPQSLAQCLRDSFQEYLGMVKGKSKGGTPRIAARRQKTSRKLAAEPV